jgi:hypothetical protein
MACAVAIPEIALSSMSTGMGKSEIAAATGRVLTSAPELANVGMLYAASTKRDLEGMIERMGFNLGPDPRYAVYTGKDNVELNALGLGRAAQQSPNTIHHTGEAPPPQPLPPELRLQRELPLPRRAASGPYVGREHPAHRHADPFT